ncbi:hypothetical protein [Plantibacter sp. M259]|uniref:hypothetical protein n=1 Tax=Plantibacter sp. M259 TaxID=2583822 RepID=UPI001110AF3A|nr:hypothetical protein [Plantibacter sp. M259]
MNTEPPASLREIQKKRHALQQAVVQDFLDDLPEPVHLADIAKRLYLSYSLVKYYLTTGQLVGVLRNGRWHIDAYASREWIGRFLASRASRRLRLHRPNEVRDAISVLVTAPDALERLRQLQSVDLTADTVVEHALRVLPMSDSVLVLHAIDELTEVT